MYKGCMSNTLNNLPCELFIRLIIQQILNECLLWTTPYSRHFKKDREQNKPKYVFLWTSHSRGRTDKEKVS